ncbi:FERM domain-containing protein 5-like isoform X2 [Babylonia areolata]|uniref:FERM domain-containing protein 5-like isoform X2 n=1 Tax=Babylonia areolata TaxID=304850 RepID=UPI003FD52F4E
MFRKRNKSEVQTEYTCSVRFLDDEPMQFTFKKDTIGQWLLDRVSEKLNLMEKDYFGLRYIDAEKQRHWLDPLKTVYKQMKGVSPMVLCFRVKFYPEEPTKLREEITRYYMFLQLRRDLHHGRLLCSPDDAVYLAAYIVQSEVGDYDPEDHPPGYISEFKMLPKQTPRLEERVMEQHRALRGQVPAEAEGNFLKRACTLDTYGVDPHQVKDQKGDHLYLGITHQGVMTFRGSRRTQLYKWTQIRRISYEGKLFVLNVSVNEDGDAGPSKKKQQPVTYKCLTASAAKYLWRSAVEQQLFFTLASASSAPKLRSGGSLFSRGSRFRFSGRCQNEAYEASQRIHRQEPSFPRSSSLPNFARRHPSGSSRNSVTLAGPRDSCDLDQSLSDVIWANGKKPEAAVDVPRGLTMRMAAAAPVYQSQARVESKSIKAPLAPQETYEEQLAPAEEEQRESSKAAVNPDVIVATSAATIAAPPPPSFQLNGQVVRDAGEGGVERWGEEEEGDTSLGAGSYHPNTTLYSEEGEEGVEEETQRLKSYLQEEVMVEPQSQPSVASERNHMSADGQGSPTTTTPLPSSSPSPSSPACQKRSGGGGGCGAVVVSVLMAVLLLATLFYVLFFSGWQHPLLTQARSHLTFLEPARDLVARHGQHLATFFSQ